MTVRYKKIIWLGSYPAHYWRNLFCKVEKQRFNKICFVFLSTYNKSRSYEVGRIPKNSIYLKNFLDILSFLKNILGNPPKLLIIQGYNTIPKFFVLILCRYKKIPFCLWGDTNYSIIKNQNYFFSLFKKIILRNILSKAKKILYIGKKNIEFYKWLLNKKIKKKNFFFLPYPTCVNTKFFKRKSNNNKLNIIYVGRLVKEKSVINFLKSLPLLKSNIIQKLNIQIFGNGKEEKTLKNFVKLNNLLKTVKFHNFRKSSEVYRCFEKADLLVLPSSKEPWGLIVNESIYYGVPVLCMDRVGAANDLIVNYKNGFLMRRNDPDEIAKFINQIFYKKFTMKKNFNFFGKKYLAKKMYLFENTKIQLIKLIDSSN